jgi:hypothetical protein
MIAVPLLLISCIAVLIRGTMTSGLLFALRSYWAYLRRLIYVICQLRLIQKVITWIGDLVLLLLLFVSILHLDPSSWISSAWGACAYPWWDLINIILKKFIPRNHLLIELLWMISLLLEFLSVWKTSKGLILGGLTQASTAKACTILWLRSYTTMTSFVSLITAWQRLRIS